jgi:hypothetical protein
MGCLKGGVVANVVIPAGEYVRLAGHYGFAPDFCHASDLESKGVVENLCGDAQRGLAAPLLTEVAIESGGVDLRAADTAAAAWCVEVNAAVHSEICAVPDERLIVERELLQPLPSLRLQTGAPSVIRKIDRLSCVRYASARYSVPTRGPRPRTTIEKQFCALGEDAEAFIIGAAAIGNTRLGSELEILLALGAAHGTDALIAALRRAVAFRRFHAADGGASS